MTKKDLIKIGTAELSKPGEAPFSHVPIYWDPLPEHLTPPGPWGRRPWPGTNAEGYGSNIITPYTVLSQNRHLRVRCSIWSNAGTNFVKQGGKDIVVRTYFDEGWETLIQD